MAEIADQHDVVARQPQIAPDQDGIGEDQLADDRRDLAPAGDVGLVLDARPDVDMALDELDPGLAEPADQDPGAWLAEVIGAPEDNAMRRGRQDRLQWTGEGLEWVQDSVGGMLNKLLRKP
jgi:hypothetical protein